MAQATARRHCGLSGRSSKAPRTRSPSWPSHYELRLDDDLVRARLAQLHAQLPTRRAAVAITARTQDRLPITALLAATMLAPRTRCGPFSDGERRLRHSRLVHRAVDLGCWTVPWIWGAGPSRGSGVLDRPVDLGCWSHWSVSPAAPERPRLPLHAPRSPSENLAQLRGSGSVLLGAESSGGQPGERGAQFFGASPVVICW